MRRLIPGLQTNEAGDAWPWGVGAQSVVYGLMRELHRAAPCVPPPSVLALPFALMLCFCFCNSDVLWENTCMNVRLLFSLADFAHSWAKARSVFPETLAEQQKVVACVAWPVPSTTTRALRRGLTDARVVRQWNRERLTGGGGLYAHMRKATKFTPSGCITAIPPGFPSTPAAAGPGAAAGGAATAVGGAQPKRQRTS